MQKSRGGVNLCNYLGKTFIKVDTYRLSGLIQKESRNKGDEIEQKKQKWNYIQYHILIWGQRLLGLNVLNLMEHGLIDGHPGPDDIPIEENQAIWVKCTGS